MLICHDAELRPNLFFWNGRIEPEDLENWLRERRLDIPRDLFDLWVATGGGDLFETETILGPFGDPEMGDDVDSVNSFHHQRGLSSNYLVFHVGVGLSAARLSDKQYVLLSDSGYKEGRSFQSLDDWYKSWIRDEYAELYGMADV